MGLACHVKCLNRNFQCFFIIYFISFEFSSCKNKIITLIVHECMSFACEYLMNVIWIAYNWIRSSFQAIYRYGRSACRFTLVCIMRNGNWAKCTACALNECQNTRESICLVTQFEWKLVSRNCTVPWWNSMHIKFVLLQTMWDLFCWKKSNVFIIRCDKKAPGKREKSEKVVQYHFFERQRSP